MNRKAFSSPAGGRHSCFYSCAPSPLGWVYWKQLCPAQSKAEAGSAIATHPQNTPKNPNCRALQLPTIPYSLPGPGQSPLLSVLDRLPAVRGTPSWICPGTTCSHSSTPGTQISLESGKARQEIIQMPTACPFLITQSLFSLLLCHPTATDIPDVVPGPSHQPACNGIILMSVVLLPTHSPANTHSEVLGRKGHSAALAQALRGFSTVLGGSRDRRGFTPCRAAAVEPRNEPPVQLDPH